MMAASKPTFHTLLLLKKPASGRGKNCNPAIKSKYAERGEIPPAGRRCNKSRGESCPPPTTSEEENCFLLHIFNTILFAS